MTAHMIDKYGTDWYWSPLTGRYHFGEPGSNVSVGALALQRAVGPLTPATD